MNFSSLRHRLALTAIDLGRQTHITKFLPELEKSQWLPTEMLAEIQITRLQQILTFASQYVPFYIRLFAENRWNPRDFCTLSDLDRLPIITKDNLRSAPLDFVPKGRNFHPSYKSRHTGGSTGEPLPYRVSNEAFGILWAGIFRVWQGTGYAFGDKTLTSGGASLKSRQANAGGPRIYNALRNNYAITVGQLDVTDLERIVNQLSAVRPSLLYGYPSILYLVARHIVHHEIAVQAIDRVITTSEMLFPGQRRLIEQAFRAPVYDQYGCPEAGLTSGECDYHQGLHYAMEICHMEVVDDTNTKVPISRTGRLIATNLINRAMCFIRYDTGDVGAISDEKCDCGRGLLMIINLEGRSRDLIYTPANKYIHGVELNHMIYDYPWIDRYQIIQETSHELKINLGVSRANVLAEVENLRFQLAELTNMTVTVGVNEPFIETNGKKNRLIISKIQIPDETE